MQLRTLVETSRHVAETSRRLQKTGLLAEFLRRLASGEIPIAISYLSGRLRQGKIGIGWAALRNAGSCPPEACNPLTILETDALFERIAAVSGPGSSTKRTEMIRELLARAVPEERDFIARLVIGELRQGSLEGIMIEALARASDIPLEKMRSAAMLSGDLPLAGRIAWKRAPPDWSASKSRSSVPFSPCSPRRQETRPRQWKSSEKQRWNTKWTASGFRLINSTGKSGYSLEI